MELCPDLISISFSNGQEAATGMAAKKARSKSPSGADIATAADVGEREHGTQAARCRHACCLRHRWRLARGQCV